MRLFLLFLFACSEPSALAPVDAGPLREPTGRPDTGGPDPLDAALDTGFEDIGSPDVVEVDAGAMDTGTPDSGVADTGAIEDGGGLRLRVVTFNTGTSPGQDHDGAPDDGYTSNEATITDEHYGNGLSWVDVVNDTAAWIQQADPDVIVFQELFYSGDCVDIPAELHPGFVCEGWSVGDPVVSQLILGPSYQVACNLGKNDKCAAVHQRVGTFAGCSGDVCMDGLDGATVPDCGGGSRIGRGTIDLVGGGTITLVNIHGTSGFARSDRQCREKQFEQVFVDLDGQPAANGSHNIVMGDLNTDPGRAAVLDSSARRFNDFVGPSEAFHFISDVGSGADPTYNGLLNIDHVVSDTFQGTCWAAGVTAGHAAVSDIVYFDHTPIVCDVEAPF